MIKLHESLTTWTPGYATEVKKRSEKDCYHNPCVKCLLEKKPSSSTEPLIIEFPRSNQHILLVKSISILPLIYSA